MTGEKYILRTDKAVCPETGARVTRYIHERGDDTVFYYSQPSITADGRYLVFWSSVSGRPEIHAVDLAAGADHSRRLSEGAHWSADHPCVDWSRNLVFYHVGRRLMRTKIDTLETDWLYEFPEGYEPLAISSNGKYVAFSFHEKMDIGRARVSPKFHGARPQLYLRPMTVIIAIELDTDDAYFVWADRNYLSHVQMCPFDQEMLFYSDQSAENRQSEVFVVPVGFIEDKRPLQLFENGRQKLSYVGHEWFTRDGWLATQMVEYTGIGSRWNDFTDTVMYNAIVRIDGTRMRRARFPGSGKPIHVHGDRADSWWVGDTTPMPRGQEMDMGMMCLIRNHWESQETELIPLFRHGHDHERPFHVHPWVNPAEDTVVFAAKHQGRNCVQTLDLAGFLSEKGLK